MHYPDYPIHSSGSFDEAQWLRILFLLSDTQHWLEQLHKDLLFQLPSEGKKKLLHRTYFLEPTALAHILERHYHLVPRYPDTGKFTIPIPLILSCIKEAFTQPTLPVKDSLYLQRKWDTGQVIGYEPGGRSTSLLTVLTDASGRIITAFPGTIQS
ncbi:MAG: hypothetical protein JSU05_00455 [Bacteroidetes bacterium]|nr:hypothetical protein [Bacteroidota bacterium]